MTLRKCIFELNNILNGLSTGGHHWNYHEASELLIQGLLHLNQNETRALKKHHLKYRIEAHICISFTAYCVYKELERTLYLEKSNLSLKTAAELTQNMYQITYTLPDSKHIKSKLLKMDDQQAELYRIILKIF